MSDIDLQHIIDADGTEEWFYLVGSPPVPPPSSPNALAKLVHSVALRNYKRYHREDGPAKIGPDGSQLWYLDGDLHRLNVMNTVSLTVKTTLSNMAESNGTAMANAIVLAVRRPFITMERSTGW
jgi:hypothetical protein